MSVGKREFVTITVQKTNKNLVDQLFFFFFGQTGLSKTTSFYQIPPTPPKNSHTNHTMLDPTGVGVNKVITGAGLFTILSAA